MNNFGAFRYYDLEGYYSSGHPGMVYKSRTLNFTDKGALQFDDQEAQTAHAVLGEQGASQQGILSNVLHGEDH